MAMPMVATPVQSPTARALAAGSGKAAPTRANEATLTTAAPTPWTARVRFSTVTLGARPQANDAAQKMTMPVMNALRRPRASASEAEVIMNMPMVRL